MTLLLVVNVKAVCVVVMFAVCDDVTVTALLFGLNVHAMVMLLFLVVVYVELTPCRFLVRQQDIGPLYR